MTTYQDVEKILLDNGVPYYTRKLVKGATMNKQGSISLTNPEEETIGISVYECGILLHKKEQYIKNLLAGEQVKINSSNETVNITI